MEAKFRALLSDESTGQDLQLARASTKDPLSLLQLGMVRQLLGFRAGTYTPFNLKTLVLLGRGFEAQMYARLANDPYQRFDALLALNDIYSELSQPASRWLDDALAAAREAPVGGQTVERFALVAERLAKVDPQREEMVFAEAEAMARSLQDADDVTRALRHICEGLLEVKKYARARSIALSIVDKYWKVDALCNVAIERLRAHDSAATDSIEEALSVIRSLSPAVPFQLLRCADGLALVNPTRACELLTEAMGHVDRQSMPKDQTHLNAKCMVTLAKVGRIDESLQRFGELKDTANPSDLAPLVGELGRVGRFDDAWTVIDQLEVPFWQASAFVDLVQFLAEAGQHREGEHVAGQLDPLHKAAALSALASVLIERSQFDEASRIVGTINDSDYRCSSEDHLAFSFARAGDSRALAMIESIKGTREKEREGDEHFEALCKIAIALFQGGDTNYDLFLTAAEDTLADDDVLSEGPAQFAATLALVGQYDRAIQILDDLDEEQGAADATLVLALQKKLAADRRYRKLLERAEKSESKEEDQRQQLFLGFRSLMDRDHRSLRVFAEIVTASMDRIFKRPFLWPAAISRDRDRCQIFFCLMKNPLLCRSARLESGREARERFLREPLALNSSERRRRLTLASGFRLLRSFGIDRLDAPAHAAGRGSACPRWLRILTITGGSSIAALRRRLRIGDDLSKRRRSWGSRNCVLKPPRDSGGVNAGYAVESVLVVSTIQVWHYHLYEKDPAHR